ncbi:hypothetical protein J6590_057360 [Homalodisca vitripennis]|nr:hypothetical protein J6590_057360 [Homalodisca vitripennis]
MDIEAISKPTSYAQNTSSEITMYGKYDQGVFISPMTGMCESISGGIGHSARLVVAVILSRNQCRPPPPGRMPGPPALALPIFCRQESTSCAPIHSTTLPYPRLRSDPGQHSIGVTTSWHPLREKNQSAEKPRLPRPRSANERGRIASPRPPHIPYAAAIAVIHCPTRVRYSGTRSQAAERRTVDSAVHGLPSPPLAVRFIFNATVAKRRRYST